MSEAEPESESEDIDPVARSRAKRRQEWLERQEPTLEEVRWARGHYWEELGQEPPDWYTQIHPEITGPNGTGESGPIPPEIDWSDLTAYRCRHCYNGCINPVDSEPAETQQCRSCHAIPD